ncbi:MAG: methyltransferase [Flavobacteriaceae bacterium]|nr:methyltransferase [Flavobacteriaceae bacterium]
MSIPFRFKQFTINQDQTAMKVGTDGVLLGAWVPIENIQSVLDIGSGTGLIALMLAQRSDAEQIDALEIEDQAYEQAVENFENSDWSDRLFCYHASLQEFVDEIDDKYDLIVSNPPFYTDTFESPNNQRSLARFEGALPFEELIESSAKLLTENGYIALIIPFKEEGKVLKIAIKNQLYLHKITRVKGTENSEIKRSLMLFSFQENTPLIDELVIEISRHQYTDEYKELVKDFYLKL